MHLDLVCRCRYSPSASLLVRVLQRTSVPWQHLAMQLPAAQEPAADAPRFGLPDGRSVALTREGVALGEALVDASVLGLDLPAVAEAAFSAVMSHLDSAQRKARTLPYPTLCRHEPPGLCPAQGAHPMYIIATVWLTSACAGQSCQHQIWLQASLIAC